MTRLFAILLSAMLCGAAVAGEVIVADTFTIPIPLSRVVAIVQANPDAIPTSTGCRVVSRSGSTIRIVKRTGLHEIDLTLSDGIRQSPLGVEYTANLVRCNDGGVTAYSATCHLSPAIGSPSSTTISLTVRVGVRGVGPVILRTHVERGVQQVRAAFQAMPR